MFESFYNGFYQQPLLLWAALLVAGIFTVRRLARWECPGKRELATYLAGLGLLSALDAWLTANQVLGLGALSSGVSSALAILFVILGDFRVFWFFESVSDEGIFRPTAAGAWRAMGWSMIVPIVSGMFQRVLPPQWQIPRVLFFNYEVLFVSVLWLYRRFRLDPRWKSEGVARTWVHRILLFATSYYALWVASDLWILGWGARLGYPSDWGFLLRVVPNVLYYGGLIAWIAGARPRESSATS
jgi:hypothetical protein